LLAGSFAGAVPDGPASLTTLGHRLFAAVPGCAASISWGAIGGLSAGAVNAVAEESRGDVDSASAGGVGELLGCRRSWLSAGIPGGAHVPGHGHGAVLGRLGQHGDGRPGAVRGAGRGLAREDRHLAGGHVVHNTSRRAKAASSCFDESAFMQAFDASLDYSGIPANMAPHKIDFRSLATYALPM